MPDRYTATIDTVWNVCREHRVRWKFISHPRLHMAMNSKSAGRGTSGKAIAVYPRDERQLRELLDRFEERLAGTEGPYILSDIRWKDTPVYLRYGGFSTIWTTDVDGNRIRAVKDPDGRLVPDVCGPVFTPPDWVEIPQWLAEGTGFERSKPNPDHLLHGYRILRSLHFSNAGGVYLAEDSRGARVVVKEARPHAGIDANGQDAVTRLRHEERVLRALADRDWAPRVIDAFTAWEHHFLVLEHLEGTTLGALIDREYPLTRPRATSEKRAEYFARTAPLLQDLECVIKELHKAGYTFGDLTPSNVMVVDGGTRVVLIDFETADPLAATRPPNVEVRGFSAPPHLSREAADWYSFACCQLWAYAPFNRLAPLNPGMYGTAVDAIGEWFGMPRAELASIRSRLHLKRVGAGRADDRRAPSSLLPAVFAAATPEDAVQLYPGDTRSSEDGSRLGLAHGAAGVMLALTTAGTAPPEEHREWLRRAVESAADDTPAGLYDGIGGAALILHRMSDPSWRKAADKVFDAPRPEGISLASGLTGLAHLCFEIGEVQQGLTLAAEVHDRLTAIGDDVPPGLMNGASGAAVLFARCLHLTGDRSWQDAHAQTVARVRGTGRRGLDPNLANGTAGLILALLSGLSFDSDDEHSELLERLDDIDVEIMPDGGLYWGHAGAAYAFAQAGRFLPEQSARANAHHRRVHRHIGAPEPGLAALIGHRSARFSLDLASGSAGAVFVERVLDDPQMYQLPGMELYKPVSDHR